MPPKKRKERPDSAESDDEGWSLGVDDEDEEFNAKMDTWVEQEAKKRGCTQERVWDLMERGVIDPPDWAAQEMTSRKCEITLMEEDTKDGDGPTDPAPSKYRPPKAQPATAWKPELEKKAGEEAKRRTKEMSLSEDDQPRFQKPPPPAPAASQYTTIANGIVKAPTAPPSATAAEERVRRHLQAMDDFRKAKEASKGVKA